MDTSIKQSIRDAIASRLATIETTEHVRILLAVESGSRAWGFASEDSDYDVRFLYLRSPDWYLSVDSAGKRDVIELPLEGELDINGWDLKKALGLFYKSNPPLLEWLGSPVVYKEASATAQRMRDLVSTYYAPSACLYHYLHMARGNFREFLKGEDVLRKKYLYVLRPLVAINWIERDLGVVPTRFQTALDAVIGNDGLRIAIDGLLRDKMAGREMDYGPRDPVLSDFIERELARLEQLPESQCRPQPPWEPLNALFRESLREVWSGDA